jgi:hypothetical protein
MDLIELQSFWPKAGDRSEAIVQLDPDRSLP